MLTDSFLNSLLELREIKISAELRRIILGCVLDWCGCFLAGAQTLKSSGRSLGELCDGVAGRALQLGYLSHLVELDDGHRFGMVHPGAPVISVLLSVAEKQEVSADDFIRAVLIGYETTIRLACAVQPGCKLRGYHATGTCGTIGAAMAVAALLHFDANRMSSAFAAATTSAAGLLEMITGQSELKPYNAGRAAMDGVMAALFGRQGFLPPEDALGGKRGFLAAMTDAPKINYLTGMPDGKLAIETSYQKPYASCRHCHAPIEAALTLAKRLNGTDEIESILVETYKLAVFGHDSQLVRNPSEAKMSIPYSVAAAIVWGDGGLGAYSDEVVSDLRVQKIAGCVRVVERGDFTNVCPAKRIARVVLRLSSGMEIDHQVDYPKGEPENPLSDEDIKRKFMGLAGYAGLSSARASDLAQEILNGKFNVGDIVAKCQTAAGCRGR